MLAIGCDHGGYDLMQELKEWLAEREILYKDFGCFSKTSCDYPDIAEPVCESVLSGECELGLLVCGTGIGMSMAANKIPGIRAAACSETFSAKYTRLHNNANILCLGGRVIGGGLAAEILDLFLHTDFEGGRHAVRVNKIALVEQRHRTCGSDAPAAEA